MQWFVCRTCFTLKMFVGKLNVKDEVEVVFSEIYLALLVFVCVNYLSNGVTFSFGIDSCEI